MSHSHCRKCHKCHTYVTSVVNVAFLFCVCCIANETMETLDISSRTCYRNNPDHLIDETKCFSRRISHLDIFLEYQRSPTHMQGALALSVYLVGIVVALFYPLYRRTDWLIKSWEENPLFSKDI
jgi:hypothetical protein